MQKSFFASASPVPGRLLHRGSGGFNIPQPIEKSHVFIERIHQTDGSGPFIDYVQIIDDD